MRTPIKIFSVVILSWLVIQSGKAQSYVGGSGMVNAGYMWTPALSSSLRSRAGTSADFRKGYSIFGAEINYRNGSSVVLLSGYIGTQEAKLHNTKLIEPFIWKVHGGIGWITFKTKSLAVYPVLGAGVFESSLIYHNSIESDVRSTTRSTSLDFSIHSDYFLTEESGEEGFFSVATVGVRLGYTMGLSAPELKGFSLVISFGGVSFMKHKKYASKI